MLDKQEIKIILEALLFASDSPLQTKKAHSILNFSGDVSLKMVDSSLTELRSEWEGKGIELINTSLGWRFQTKEKYSQYVQKLWADRPIRHSRATLETLAIIAYKQPVTRSDIEAVRGVSVSSQIVKSLEEKGWIETVGRKDVLGRPLLYATTKSFLADLGLKSLEELPAVSPVESSSENVGETKKLL